VQISLNPLGLGKVSFYTNLLKIKDTTMMIFNEKEALKWLKDQFYGGILLLYFLLMVSLIDTLVPDLTAPRSWP
jgi:hypothetical protein